MQTGIELVDLVYRITGGFPKSEVFVLSSQMQRAAISIPSNIAEGHARTSRKEFLHFISISLGSLAELETHIFVAQRLKYVSQEELSSYLLKTEQLGRMIRGLQKSLNASSTQAPAPNP